MQIFELHVYNVYFNTHAHVPNLMPSQFGELGGAS
jgi:hypothetical protein